MPIDITYNWDNQQNTISFSDVDIIDIAQRYGWRPNVPDPSYARSLELKQAEFYSAEPNSPERAAIAAELQLLQQQGGSEIPNPQTASDFAVEYVSNMLQDLFVDKQAIQAAAQEKVNADTSAARAAIKAKFNFVK